MCDKEEIIVNNLISTLHNLYINANPCTTEVGTGSVRGDYSYYKVVIRGRKNSLNSDYVEYNIRVSSSEEFIQKWGKYSLYIEALPLHPKEIFDIPLEQFMALQEGIYLLSNKLFDATLDALVSFKFYEEGLEEYLKVPYRRQF